MVRTRGKDKPARSAPTLYSADAPSIDELNRLTDQSVVAESRTQYESSDKGGFKDLKVYQSALDFVAATYKAVRCFPKEEMFALASQVRRAACSVPLNIAEGWGRRSRADFARFCDIARASLQEVDAALDVAKRLGYLKAEDLNEVFRLLNRVSEMLWRLATKLRT